jgi:hypothetical protein
MMVSIHRISRDNTLRKTRLDILYQIILQTRSDHIYNVRVIEDATVVLLPEEARVIPYEQTANAPTKNPLTNNADALNILFKLTIALSLHTHNYLLYSSI